LYTKTAGRNFGGPVANPPSTDFLDNTVIVTLATSGAALTLSNILNQGGVICEDITKLLVNDLTTPTPETGVLPFSAAAGPPLGVYQGSTITNASTTATQTVAIQVRRYGYGVVAAGGATISNLVGGVITVAPGAQTTQYGIQATPVLSSTAGGSTYYVGVAMATGARTTSGAIVASIGATTFAVVNAMINVLG
jgi:hypothetical protein